MKPPVMLHPATSSVLASFPPGEPIWLFAYGSLLHRPHPALEHRERGLVRGLERRFYQASTDHRGTPDFPGRVVTLVPRDGAECQGVAFRIAPELAPTVFLELDEREQGGYVLCPVDFEPEGRARRTVAAVAYIGLPGNPFYVGPESLRTTADIVMRASGPSGHNVEYVLRLAEALSELEMLDNEVFELANLLSDPDGLVDEGAD